MSPQQSGGYPGESYPSSPVDVTIYRGQGVDSCYVIGGCPKNLTQNRDEIYNVAHQTSDILLTDECKVEPV